MGMLPPTSNISLVGLPPAGIPAGISNVAKPALPPALPAKQGTPIAGGISRSLSDFIEFQTMIASSKNLHLKDQKRVSVAKTTFLSAALGTVATAVPTAYAAINGRADTLFLIPMLGTFAAGYGAVLGLLLNHNRD